MTWTSNADYCLINTQLDALNTREVTREVNIYKESVLNVSYAYETKYLHISTQLLHSRVNILR